MTPGQLLQPVGIPANLNARPGAAAMIADARRLLSGWGPTTVRGVSSPVARDSLTVLVFSHRPEVREGITMAVGRRPAPDLGRVRFLEAGGVAEVLAAADAGGFDLAILDGEAQPTGGMGLARQLKNEIDDCPPIIITVRRRDDRWLATWSQADAVLVHPLDPLTAAETVADVLRRAAAGDRSAPRG